MEGAKCNCGKQGPDGLMLRGGLDYTIPEGYEAKIEDGKIIVRKKESKDERIKRELIEYLRGDLDDITTDDTDRWISWLEKQKEQRYTKEEVLEELRIDLCNNDIYRVPEWLREVLLMAKENGKKEQQHAGWSEEDEEKIQDIIASIDTNIAASDFHEMEDWLKSLRPQPQWKPTEEQMNGLAHAINLDVYDAKRYHLDSLFDDLKKL